MPAPVLLAGCNAADDLESVYVAQLLTRGLDVDPDAAVEDRRLAAVLLTSGATPTGIDVITDTARRSLAADVPLAAIGLRLPLRLEAADGAALGAALSSASILTVADERSGDLLRSAGCPGARRIPNLGWLAGDIDPPRAASGLGDTIAVSADLPLSAIQAVATLARDSGYATAVLSTWKSPAVREAVVRAHAALGPGAEIIEIDEASTYRAVLRGVELYVGASPFALAAAWSLGTPAIGIATDRSVRSRRVLDELTIAGATTFVVRDLNRLHDAVDATHARDADAFLDAHGGPRAVLREEFDRVGAVVAGGTAAAVRRTAARKLANSSATDGVQPFEDIETIVETLRDQLASTEERRLAIEQEAAALREDVSRGDVELQRITAEMTDGLARQRERQSVTEEELARRADEIARLVHAAEQREAHLEALTGEVDRLSGSLTESEQAVAALRADLNRVTDELDDTRRQRDQARLERDSARTDRDDARRDREAQKLLLQERQAAFEEARELLRGERTSLDDAAGELAQALQEVRRAKESRAWRIGHAMTRAARRLALRGSASNKSALDRATSRLGTLDRAIKQRERPVLGTRQVRSVNGRRKRITVISWDMGHNPAGRAFLLADVAGHGYDVELVGPQFERYGSKIWEPITNSRVKMRTFPGADLPDFLDEVEQFARSVETDLVYVSKPRFPSLALAMAIKENRGVPVVVDVDDRELSFFNSTSGMTLDALEQRRGSDDFVVPYGESWTLACDSLIADADAVTVSSRALQLVYGGTVVPHARDESSFDPSRFDRDAIRASYGYEPTDRVILFLGTPRMHKGVVELAEALEQIGNPRYKLCIIGTVTDPPLRAALSRFSSDQVQLVPNQPFEDLAKNMMVGDLVCLLQRADSEIARYQMPAKFTDALAMGIPMLVRETPPLAPHIEAGIVHKLGDEPLAERIDDLFRDFSAVKAQANRAREVFLREFSYTSTLNTMDRVFSRASGGTSELPASWRRAYSIARTAGQPAQTAAPVKLARHPLGKPVVWNVAFFWKQNDSWIYGRRSDMLMKYLAQSDRTARLVHFDAPTDWTTLHEHRRRAADGANDQSLEMFRSTHRRAFSPSKEGDLRSYAYVRRTNDGPAGMRRSRLPREASYLEFVSRVLGENDFTKNPTLFWVWPVNFEFPAIRDALQPDIVVADVVDDHRVWSTPGTSAYARLTENYREILTSSDLVLANCNPVAERMTWFGVDAHVIPNAMEIWRDRRDQRKAPADLRHIKGPIIGYAGNLSSRIDVDLLDRMAREHPEWSQVFIGSTHLSRDILRLDRHPNVHFLGVRTYPDVVRYIRNFDVAMIPHQDNHMTRSMNPLKAFVYAGCGVPVVTTEIANLGELQDTVRVARSPEDFMSGVQEMLALGRDGAIARTPIDVLRRNTWEARVKQIEGLLDGLGTDHSTRRVGALLPV